MFSDEFKQKFQIVGLVETHLDPTNEPDMISRRMKMGYDAASNPAQKYSLSTGNHGGEAILTTKYTYSIPIAPIVLASSVSVNLEVQRFVAKEVRFGKMSVLTITAYFWCGEGLSGRNWSKFIV